MRNFNVKNKIGLALLYLTWVSVHGMAQPAFAPELSGFSKTVLKHARANDDVTFMTATEKEVVFYMNLARMEPQQFLEKVVKPYVREFSNPKSYYVTTLIKQLKTQPKAPPLEMRPDLYKAAKQHQLDIGKYGIRGHTSSNGMGYTKRIKPLLKYYDGLSENIGYGYRSPIEIVLELLIDKGVKSFGHRNAILNRNFSYTGVSIGSHKNFETVCVIEYGLL